MRDQYGDKMNYIQSYINMVKQGQDVDYAAFQMSYKAMIKVLISPGPLKSESFSSPSPWSVQGRHQRLRYIEDEMYAAYTPALNTPRRKRSAPHRKRSFGQVAESYDALVTQYKAYEAAMKLSETAGTSLEKILALNKIGKADYDEVKDARENYQDMQMEAIDALATYNTLLYDFDRLTCGAITLYMKGEGISTSSGGGGDSFAKLDPINDPYYYIYNSVADITFSIGVSIPEGFEPTIDSFEIWVDGTQVGERTPTNEELTHLALDYQESSEITIRLYNGDDFVCECVVDASVPRDVLPIEPAGDAAAQEDLVLGSYSVDTVPIGELSTSTLTLKLNPDVDAKTFTISYGDHGEVSTTGKLKTSESLTYLTLLIASLDSVTLNLNDASGGLTYTARFDTENQSIIKIPEAE